ncbi:hypothetical protein [Parasitella parasitica]|uniref:Uncharacterized protein n=1 Tax=Parasitella parasitica TaxID=35722 RepID=A0A0B7NBT4_9FUNG|nr:hypothetical protein [Parasitella parasitica]
MEIIEATQEPEQVPEEPEQVPEEPEQVSEKSKEQLKEIWKKNYLGPCKLEYYEKTCAVVKNVEQEFEKNVRANLKKDDMIKELNQQLETLKEELEAGLEALTDEKSLAKNLIEEKRELLEKMKQEKTQKFYKDLDEEITKVLALHQSDWKKDLKKALTNTQKAYVIQQTCKVIFNDDLLFAADSAVRQTEYSKYA